MTRLAPYLLSAPAAALAVGLLGSPVAFLFRVSLFEPPRGRGFYSPGSWTGENYAAVLDGHGRGLLGFTLLFGVGVSLGTLVIAYPTALFVRNLPGRAHGPALGLILLPKLAGPLVTLFGLQQLLSATGPVCRVISAITGTDSPPTLTRNLFGAVCGEAYLILPYAVLVLYLQLRRIDPLLETAARGLGASRGQVFRRVTLPLSVPGLVLTGQLGLMWGLAAFLGPQLLGGPDETTLSVEIHRQAFEYGRWPRAAAGAVLLLVTTGGCLAGYAALTRPRRGAA